MVGATPQPGVIASWGSSVRGRARRRAISPVASSHEPNCIKNASERQPLATTPKPGRFHSESAAAETAWKKDLSIRRSTARPHEAIPIEWQPFRQRCLRARFGSASTNQLSALGILADHLQSRSGGRADSLRTVIFSRRPLTQACGSTEITEGCLHLPDTSLQEKLVRLSLK